MPGPPLAVSRPLHTMRFLTSVAVSFRLAGAQMGVSVALFTADVWCVSARGCSLGEGNGMRVRTAVSANHLRFELRVQGIYLQSVTRAYPRWCLYTYQVLWSHNFEVLMYGFHQ
jgi:hypothetical protein